MLGFLTILLTVFFVAAFSAGMLTWIIANPGILLAAIAVAIILHKLENKQ